MKKVIIITGYLASGKSYFYNKVKQEMQIDAFSKDELKINISRNLKSKKKFDDYELGNIAFKKMIDEIEKLMESQKDIIIEGAFSNETVKNKENEQKRIMELIKKYEYTCCVFRMTGEMKILYERFVYREKSGERNYALQFDVVCNYRIFDLINKKLDKCLLGDYVIEIDTTDFSKVDYLKYFDIIKKFIGN